MYYIIIFCFITIIPLFSSPVFADEVYLKNGDLITGDIIKMKEHELSLQTPYAEKIKVKWSEVICIKSKKELFFLTNENKLFTGQVTCPSHGFIQIAGDKVEKTIKLPLDRFNSISLTPPQTGIKFTGNITAGGTLSKGNTDSEAANASAKMESKVKNHRLNLGLKHNYGKTSGKLNARYTSCNIKYDYFLSKKLYNYAQSLFEQDAMQDLNLRSIYGIGAGYQILDTKRKKVFLETGISYLDEDYDESDDRHTTSGRWSFGFKYEAIPDRIKIFHLHEGYYSLEESNSYYIRSEQGVRLPLIAYFSANFEIDYNYNSRPAPGKKKSDTIYIIGLSYDFEF